jgi:large subunit ribosomal protein L32
MAVPKRKTSPSRRNMRRSHDGLESTNIAFDSRTGAAKLSHHISLEDGYYKGKQVFVPKHLKRALAKMNVSDDNVTEPQDISKAPTSKEENQ